MNFETAIPSSFVAFCGDALLARGELATVARAVRDTEAGKSVARLAVYRESTGAVLDIDTSGSVADMLQRLADEYPDAIQTQDAEKPEQSRQRGRPKLGVTSREVSLLPRHWEWLGAQGGSASATLRRLVEQARKAERGEVRLRSLVDATHRFMWDAAGDEHGFEEASRALFGHDWGGFRSRIDSWPKDIRDQLERYLVQIWELDEAKI